MASMLTEKPASMTTSTQVSLQVVVMVAAVCLWLGTLRTEVTDHAETIDKLVHLTAEVAEVARSNKQQIEHLLERCP